MPMRMLPPPTAGSPLILGNATYTRSPTGYVDAHHNHSATLSANGWTQIAPSGPTSDRTSPASRGALFIDTTLGAVIAFDGRVWRDVLTGDDA